MTEAETRPQGRSHKVCLSFLPPPVLYHCRFPSLLSLSSWQHSWLPLAAGARPWLDGSGTTRRKTGGNQGNLSRSSLSPYLSSPVQIRLPSLNKISTDRKASVTPPKSNPFPHQIPNQPERLRYPCEIDSSLLLLLTAALQ